tara:strand:+ start:61 stop:486 length:426 start_codon:yes stop_codon:yes gene_type:complete
VKKRYIKDSDHWETPLYLYEELDQEFKFDFDPCPIMQDITPETDGLSIDWGQVNFINPPYSLDLKTAFVLRAIDFSKKGRTCVMVLPVSTSTKLFHDHIQPNAKEIRFIKGRVPFIGRNAIGEKRKNKTGMHDSMIVVFNG